MEPTLSASLLQRQWIKTQRVGRTIKRGSDRAPGSGGPHVEIRNGRGERVDPYGHGVTRKSPGNHTPIIWDW